MEKDDAGQQAITAIRNEKALDLIKRFGLIEYYPGKLTIQHAREKVKDRVEKEQDIPWYFIGMCQ